MPDVDTAVTILTEACTDIFVRENDKYKEAKINALNALCDNNLPTFLRKKSNEQKKNFALSLNRRIKSILSETYECEVLDIRASSRNNKKDADLFVKCKYDNEIKEEKVELKFGKETLRAIGIETFDKIFVVGKNEEKFYDLFKRVKENQRKYANKHPGDFDGLVEYLRLQLSPIIEKINNQISNHRLIIDSREIQAQLKGTGSVDSSNEVVPAKKLLFYWNGVEVKEVPDVSGTWAFKSVTPSAENGARICFLVTNGKYEAKFLLHWKNDLQYGKYKYPAKTGINSYCFNVWLSKL